MSAEVFSEAMGLIGEKYIMEAATYQRKWKRHSWGKWIAAAACVCLVLAGIFPLLHNQPGASPFVLTAYAVESDNTVSSAIMQEGASVPISLFETDSGIKGFVFSYDNTEPEQSSSISVMTDGTFPGVVNEIVGLDLDKDSHYLFYVPDQTQAAPYSLMIPHLENDMVYEYHIAIDETDSGYIATIEQIVSFEQKLQE